jgi:hypothetical protein
LWISIKIGLIFDQISTFFHCPALFSYLGKEKTTHFEWFKMVPKIVGRLTAIADLGPIA